MPPLTATPRTLLGRKVKQLRRDGLLPANIYGKNIKSQAVQLPVTDFLKVYQQAGETGLIELKVEGEKSPRPVLVHHLQLHPVTDLPLHADFHQVDLKEKVTAAVPVEITGESPAVSQKGGVFIQSLTEIEVQALPVDLPDKFTIDISRLAEIHDAVYLKDLQFDQAKVTIDLDPQTLIARIEPPTKAEEEERPAPAEGEEAAAGKEKESQPQKSEGVKEGAKPGQKPVDQSSEKPAQR